MRLGKLSLGLVLVTGGLVSCGDSGASDAPIPEFVQNVNQVPYALSLIRVNSEVESLDGTWSFFNTEIKNQDDISSEKVARVTSNETYVLAINGEKAEINVGSSSRFDSTRERNQDDGCELRAKARARGEARYDRLDLVYELDSQLRGEACPASIVEDYLDFQQEELTGLRLNVINRLLEAGVWDLENSKRVRIRIELKGVATLGDAAGSFE